jgi:N-acetylglucosaminyldiphosphoundecaprenol N-acetyl-beta-D-mannosaminyltransferase
MTIDDRRVTSDGMPVGATPDPAVQLVGGVPFRITDFPSAIEWVLSLAAGTPRALNVRFLNAWNVALARRDGGYRALLAGRGVNFPDGTPVAWLLKLRGLGCREVARHADQIRGPSVFNEVMRQGVSRNVRHFLLGGTPEVLDRLADTLTTRYDGIRVVGRYAPPFAPLTADYLADCAARIRTSKPDLVWVGLGTPKQDYAGAELSEALGLPVLGVGAAFDFAAGAKREAPAWMQRSALEWLFRLVSEPRRLWRRYLVGNVEFLIAVVTEWAADRRAANS